MIQLIRYLWALFLFTFPFSIRFLVYENASYRFGNFNPWVSGFVYLPEILLLIIFGLWFFSKLKTKNYKLKINAKWLWVLFGLFAINAFIITLIKGDSFLGAMFILRLFEMLAVVWLIADEILKSRQIVIILLFSALLQIVWGFMQWQLNHSLGLALLGESVIGPDVLGAAKIELANGVKQIRAYGTFLHPNIFAAYLLVIYFLSLNYLKGKSRFIWLIPFVFGLYLTHSRAAWIIGLIGLTIHFLFSRFKKTSFHKSVALIAAILLIAGNILLFYKSGSIKTTDSSIKERLTQNVISREMFKVNPLGVGVNNFTLEMESYSYCGPNGGPSCGSNSGSIGSSIGSSTGPQRILNRKLSPWDFQPVHNTYFLILNEVGAQGLLLFIAFTVMLIFYYWRQANAAPIFALLLLAPFDHFLWDSFAGIMLIALAAGFFVSEESSHIK